MSRLLVYALGGGAGHLTRALSLARAASRRGHDVTILSNSPWASALRKRDAWPTRATLRWIDAATPKEAVVPWVREHVAKEPHDALVVDTFPRGLAGELPELLDGERRPKVWVHRDMTPEYASRPDVVQAASGFDLVLAPGEHGPLAEQLDVRSTAPWLGVDFGEMLSRTEARGALGVSQEPVVLVIGSPNAEENAEVATLAAKLAEGELGWSVRFASLDVAAVPEALRAPPVWPLMKLFAGVDALIGAGGYNTVYEARATGVPLLAVPRARLYDRQELRLRAEERTAPGEVAERLRGLGARSRSPAPFENGAHEAARLVAELLA